MLVIPFLGISQILVPNNKVTLPNVILETSGMEWLNDSVWVTHNDSGNDSELFFLKKDGKIESQIKLINSPNIDWEDITYDGKEFLYIADLGNNLHNRQNLAIRKFSLLDSSEKTFHINYVSQIFPVDSLNYNYDCEAMAMLNGKIYLFSKNNTEPYNGICRMYKFDPESENGQLLVEDSVILGDEGYWKNSVTSADFSDDGKKLAILTYGYLFIFYDYKGDDFFNGKYMRFRLPEIQQREAVTFDKENNIWITDENSRLSNGGFLYFYNMEKIWRGDFYFRETEIGIAKVKRKVIKNEKSENSYNSDGFEKENCIYEYKIEANITNKGNYWIEFYENEKLISSIEKISEKKLSFINRITNPNSETVYSYRIYFANKLIFANKFTSE